MDKIRRQIVKQSDITGEVATIPITNDHGDGSWLKTDIYVGEFFLNTVDNILQQRTETGIITVNGGGGGSVSWGSITGTLSSQTDIQTALDEKANKVIPTITLDGSRSLILSDQNKNLENSSDIIVTIPNNKDVSFDVGSVVFFTKKAEIMVITPASGVTINSVDSLTELGRINSGCFALKIGVNEWNLIGELI